MKKLISCCFLFLLIIASVSAQITYTSRTAYDLAHPINYVIDFNNDGPDGTFYPGGLTASTPFGNVTFTGIPQTSISTEVLSATHFGFANASDFVLQANPGQFLTDSLQITLPVNTFSFGTDVISPSATVPEPYQFTIFSGATVLDTIASPSITGSDTFIGFDSLTSPITSVTVQIENAIGNPNPVLDNFTVVPESSTWLPAALALAAIGYLQRKKLSAFISFLS